MRGASLGRIRVFFLARGPYRDGVYGDGNAEIRAAFPNRVTQVAESVIGIRIRIAGDNQAAAPPHELINAQVFEVAAVGKIDIPAFVARQSKQFRQQINN